MCSVRPMKSFVLHIAVMIPLVCNCTGCKSRQRSDDSLYKRFQAQEKAYFMHVASDCDSILKEHPIGSAGLETASRAPGWFSLSSSDATLPRSIKTLNPDRILISTNRLWVNCGGCGRLDWGFMWEQLDAPHTNTWALRSCIAYSFERTLYVEKRP